MGRTFSGKQKRKASQLKASTTSATSARAPISAVAAVPTDAGTTDDINTLAAKVLLRVPFLHNGGIERQDLHTTLLAQKVQITDTKLGELLDKMRDSKLIDRRLGGPAGNSSLKWYRLR